MKKLILFTFALLAVGLLFLAPVTVVEASGSPGEPVGEACKSCHKVAETMLADGGDAPSSEMGTVPGVATKGGAGQVAMEGSDIEWLLSKQHGGERLN